MVDMGEVVDTRLGVVAYIADYAVDHTRGACGRGYLTGVEYIERQSVVGLVAGAVCDGDTLGEAKFGGSLGCDGALDGECRHDFGQYVGGKSEVIHQEGSGSTLLEVPEHHLREAAHGGGHTACETHGDVVAREEDFPYAIRSVTEIMSQNGSTSMAATCSSCMALMDAGVPLKRPVSGVAMGLMVDVPMGQEITDEDIAEVVSKWTGVPVSKLVESESEKLIEMENILHKRVIGQNEAVGVVSDSIRRARSGLKDPKRPIGVFLFLGPTGVGKTELAKTLSEFMFQDEDALIRIDMSEYMEKHSVARLIGAPPGYVGYDEGGQLTERVRRKPYSVVLFDEIEKAHPDVFNILLQVLDDGRLTDNKGRNVNFKNTIIIMTSNMGSQLIRENFSKMTPENREETIDATKMAVLDMLKQTIRPEFLNRIDEIIMFTPLSKPEIQEIVGLQIRSIQKMLASNSGIDLRITPAALEYLADEGYDPEFGARPVKRAIHRLVLNQLSKDILAQKVDRSHPIIIDKDGDKLIFKN